MGRNKPMRQGRNSQRHRRRAGRYGILKDQEREYQGEG
jgi:hypothetical protein